jgi:very-short-patch-repair endonuclease
VRQYELFDAAGLLVARFDLADPPARVAVELDSYRHHSGRQAWRRDQGRHNRATALGWLVFYATEDDLHGPAGVAFRQAVDGARLRRAG